MNKAELVDAMAKEAKMTKVDARRALDAFVRVAGDAMGKGERVSMVGFGSFTVSKKAACMGRNPRTGAAIKIPAKNVVRFKAGSDLNTKVLKKK